jgi:hypothetical protein
VSRKIEPIATDYGAIIRLLANGGIDFILIGGLAAIGHGLALHTLDVDVVYSRQSENIRRLVTAFISIQPYLRGAPPGLPFRFDEKTVQMGLNFTLRTKLGDVDLLGEVGGGGTYEELLPFSADGTAYGVRIRIVELDKLIALKRAAGRPKDAEAIAQLEALRQEKRKLEGKGNAIG